MSHFRDFDVVNWGDGMLLKPQHFQYNDQLNRASVFYTQRSVQSFFWGFTNLSIDPDQLTVGTVKILEASGFFPDGTPFVVSKNQLPGFKLELDQNVKTVYLALANDGVERYQFQESRVTDLYKPDSPAEQLETGKYHLQIRTDQMSLEGYSRLPVIKIAAMRTDQSIVRDEKFIPPCLKIYSVANMQLLVSEILGTIRVRTNSLLKNLAKDQRLRGTNAVDFAMAQTMSKNCAQISHILQGGHSHPEQLFSHLVSMMGELQVFKFNEEFPKIPEYDHDNIWESYNQVLSVLRGLITQVSDRGAMVLPLNETRYGILKSTVQDRRIFSDYDFIIAISADATVDVIKKDIAPNLKVGSLNNIEMIVHQQLYGVGLETLTNIPQQISYQSGTAYYRIQKNGELWDEIKEVGGFGLYSSARDLHVAIELWAIKLD